LAVKLGQKAAGQTHEYSNIILLFQQITKRIRAKKCRREGKEEGKRGKGMRKAMVIFGRLQEMRQEKKVLHKLLDIVIITIIAVMCGCTDWEEVSTFGSAREEILGKYLELRNGMPSHDTFRRVMGLIKAEALEECYRQWVNAILGSARLAEKKGDNIGVDGKTIRGSGKPGLKPLHLISAWSSRAGLTLAQLKTAEKSNEITAIPELLEVLDIAGSIVTIDAMGCQTDIAKTIIAGSGEYVLACKENQAGLYNDTDSKYTSLQTERDMI
jgi:predicted transposase YbfD/YdcC